MTAGMDRSLRPSRRRFRPALERLEDRNLLSPTWSNFGHDPQHTGVSPVASQPIDTIRWQAPVDLNPTGAFIHYGSPVITAGNTIIIPVKTGAFGGFELTARNGADGTALWTNTSDYTLPPFSWMPPFGPALTPSNRLYLPGNGGTVYYINNPDSPRATISGQLAFYGIANYNANPDAYNSTVMIDTPITADSAGNIYFGFEVLGSNPSGIVGGGIARIDANGNGTWVQANTAANDSNITKVPLAAAPALSNDGSTLYVSVNNDGNFYGYLLGLDSTTLATKDKVFLKDPRHGSNAGLLDISTATPMVAPDGTVFYGVFGNPFNGSRGFLLHFSADLTRELIPGAFGWDDTPSIVPVSMVPSYHGKSPYLIFAKYNNYVASEVGSTGGSGVNLVAVLDPYAGELDPRNDGDKSLHVMNEVLTIAGPTPDPAFRSSQFPDAVREWCINNTAVDPATKSILVNSEDGNVYRWNLVSNTLTQAVNVTLGIGEPYVPTLIGPDGTVYAVNGGTVFALGGFSNYTLTDVASVNPIVLGQPVTFSATLASTNGGPTPTGSISFLEGSTLLGLVVLSNGQASFSTSSLSAGNHFITAAYTGDTNYTAGSTELVESVRYQSSSALASSANPSVFGQPVNLIATVSPVSPGTATPTGRVTFMAGSMFLGVVNLSDGQALLRIVKFPVGTHLITFSYSGDVNYAPSTSNVLTQVTNPDPTTTLLRSSAHASLDHQSVTFTATVLANPPGLGAVPSGTVTFMDGSTVLGTAVLVNGRAAFSTNLSVGPHSIQALYDGSPQFSASNSAVLVQTVRASALGAVLLASNNPAASANSGAASAPGSAEPWTYPLIGLEMQMRRVGISEALPIGRLPATSGPVKIPGTSLGAISLADLEQFFAVLEKDVAQKD